MVGDGGDVGVVAVDVAVDVDVDVDAIVVVVVAVVGVVVAVVVGGGVVLGPASIRERPTSRAHSAPPLAEADGTAVAAVAAV